MAAVLDQAGYENRGVLLEEKDATIRESLAAMCQEAAEGDHLVFSFSGHGVRGRANKGNKHTNDLFLYCTCGGQSELGLMEVTSLLSQSKAKTCLVVLDCSQSGNKIARGAGTVVGVSSTEDLSSAIDASLKLASVRLDQLPRATTRGAEDDYEHAESHCRCRILRRGRHRHGRLMSCFQIPTYTVIHSDS
eukprot:TRINITY_DN8285_c0_g2_i1.p1 TRINITY_DN8285_c0_g2~~TRINITY_DN8285_c0_g2_i1.p1  ORF type:complete len:191 (+),score=18.08 TRINITY_DN8285_c0_g2_i1:290-862(+)